MTTKLLKEMVTDFYVLFDSEIPHNQIKPQRR